MRSNFPTTKSLNRLEKLNNGNFAFFSHFSVCFWKFAWQPQKARLLIICLILFYFRNGHFCHSLKCCHFSVVWLFVCLFFFCLESATRSSSCQRSRAPAWRGHDNFLPYPWQNLGWNFLSSSNIWLYHILQIGIRIWDEERKKTHHCGRSRLEGLKDTKNYS